MDIKNLPVPEVYQESSDFRFFIKWIACCFAKLQYDIENIFDLYDPLRCPESLLWMLADTMGYKYDERFSTAYMRYVLLYFMSMIRNRGSKDGMTLAAEVNLAQFRIMSKGNDEHIYNNRLDDVSLPVNTAYVTPHTNAGYIDVVYFSDKVPEDACTDYVRPVGMFCFQSAGVRYDARTKISIDAKLANIYNTGEVPPAMSLTATHVGHYRRDDYARIQKTAITTEANGFVDDENNVADIRRPVYYRNSKYEGSPDNAINPGYRALSSLQLCNNDDTLSSIINAEIFEIGYGPQDVSIYTPEEALKKKYNLLYNKTNEESLGDIIYTTESGSTPTRPIPQVNAVMATIGDAIAMVDSNGDPTNTHTSVDSNGDISIVPDPVNN